VASCGTAFGDDHLQMIRRLMLDDTYFCGELIYTFDGDEAGQKAAKRAFEGNQKFTGQSYVAVAPDNLDPCDLRLQKGDAAVRDLVASRVPMFEFMIRAVIADYRLDTPEGRLQAMRRAVPIVASIHDRALQSEYARRLSGWVGWMDEDEVLSQVRVAARNPQPAEPRRAVRFDSDAAVAVDAPQARLPQPDAKSIQLWPQRESLKLALQYPGVVADGFDAVPEAAFSFETYRVIRHAIAQAGGCRAAVAGEWAGMVASEIDDLIGRSLVSELVVEDIHLQGESVETYWDRTVARLQEQQVSNEISQLKSKMQRMRPSDDEQAYRSMFANLIALEQQKKQLLARAFQ